MKKACLMLMVTDLTLTSLYNLHLSDSLLSDSLACLGRSWARECLPFPSRAKVVFSVERGSKYREHLCSMLTNKAPQECNPPHKHMPASPWTFVYWNGYL